MTLGFWVAMAASRMAILSCNRVQVYIRTDEPFNSICLMILSGVLFSSSPVLQPYSTVISGDRRHGQIGGEHRRPPETIFNFLELLILLLKPRYCIHGFIESVDEHLFLFHRTLQLNHTATVISIIKIIISWSKQVTKSRCNSLAGSP